MLPGTTAPKILPRANQDFCLIVWRTIQHEVSVLASMWVLSQRVEKRIGETRPLERLQELFRDNHVCVDIFEV